MHNKLPLILKVPESEISTFKKYIKSCRSKHIRSSQEIVDLVFEQNPSFKEQILNGEISNTISSLREIGYNLFLEDEVTFNAVLMRDLHKILETPKEILKVILDTNIKNVSDVQLLESVKDTCGEYAGRVFPYIYELSLSNTQSRRSRAGKTFESIIYKIYEILNYKFDSQSKVGRKIFSDLGLGKKVDSILPSIDCFEKSRSKTIIGTMKTTLRERWAEVAEEIERTKIPVIHLLTVDEEISLNKAQEMSKHNIIIVTYSWVAKSNSLKKMKNIISFEDYLFQEIPAILKFWEENES